MSEINEALKEYIKDNISPKEFERNKISVSYETLKEVLKGNNFQSGSYARFTAITPVNDLDVIWELPEDILARTMLKEKTIRKIIDPSQLDISNVLLELAEKLRKEYEKRGIPFLKIKAQTHSVGIYFGPSEDDFSIDIVPAVPNGINDFGEPTYLVPEIIKFHKDVRLKMYYDKTPINWVKSDPRGYIKEATDLNNANDNYRYAIKFCKKWKWHLKNKYPNLKFKSFHIEMIIKDLLCKNLSVDSLGVVKSFFNGLADYLDYPKIPDRADNGKFIDEYLNELSQEDKNLIINKGTKSLLILNDLNDNSDVNKILHDLFNDSQSKVDYTNKIVEPISRPYSKNYENRS